MTVVVGFPMWPIWAYAPIAWRALVICRRPEPTLSSTSGLVVAPGFINVLSWATESLIADGRSQGDIRHGVTLEIFAESWSTGPLNEEMKKEGSLDPVSRRQRSAHCVGGRKYESRPFATRSTGNSGAKCAAAIDVAIRLGPSTDSSLVGMRLMDTRHRVCASPGYLRRHRAPWTPAALAEHDCLRFALPGYRTR